MKNRAGGNCIKNQNGFTLVELLVGMAILSIVAAAITSFIVSSSRSYAAANTEIVVQQEAQLAMNQISDVIIDTTRSVNYVGYTADGSVSQQAVKDADFTIDVEDKSLTLFNGEGTVVLDAHGNPVLDADGNPELARDADGKPIISGGSGNQRNYQFYYDKSEEKLYYAEIELNEDTFPQTEADGMVLLADYVTDFSVDLSQVEEKRVVQLTVSYEYNHKVYETSNNITIRNRVLVNSVNLAVNRTVELSVIPRENMVVLEPGEDYYHFSTPRVEGRNILDKSVTWSVSAEMPPTDGGAGRTEFTDASNGIIHISSGETANAFKVTVTTNAVDSAGNHATADVIVYVKRVKTVSLNKSADSVAENAPNEISAGCNFTISAHVEGNKLGVTCSDCGDDTSIDRYVVENENAYSWKLIDPNGICTMSTSDHGKAEFSISSSAQAGQTVTIEATSLLSTQTNSLHRNYDKVTGYITLTVASRHSDLTLGGGLKYGSRELYLQWDYVPHTAYICVRIKTEDPNAPTADDKVMIYRTDGKAILIAPDVFGLDLNYNYYLSIQVLAADAENGVDIQTPDVIVNDYLGHIDGAGTYVGERKSSSKITVPLYKPQLTIEYNGEEYTGTEIDISPIYFLSTDERSIFCNVTKASSAKGDGGEIVNNVKTNLYLGDGEGNPLYYMGESKTGQNERGLLKFNTESGKIVLALGRVDQNDINNNNRNAINKARETVGSYHYIPYFTYSNAAVASAFTVYYKNYEPNYGQQLCVRPESKVNFTITDEGNLTLWAYTSRGEFKKGEILFPVPSDSSFRNYFSLNNPALQSVITSNSFMLSDSDGNIYVISFSRMTCRYITTEDSYEIELFYECTDSLWNRKTEMSAGAFKCPANGTEWSRTSIGELDEQLNKGNTTVYGKGNARITIDGKSYEAYIPLPSDAQFTNTWWGNFGFDIAGFKNGTKLEQTSIYGGVSIVYRENAAGGAPQRKELSCPDNKIKCSYDISTKTYTLTIFCYKPDWSGTFELGTFTCKDGDTSWTEKK